MKERVPIGYRLCQALILMHMLNKGGIKKILKDSKKVEEFINTKMTKFWFNKYLPDIPTRRKALKNDFRDVFRRFLEWVKEQQEILELTKECADNIKEIRKNVKGEGIDFLKIPEFKELHKRVKKHIVNVRSERLRSRKAQGG